MFSRKYPALDPRYVADAQPTTTAILPVQSVGFGTAPALLGLPVSTASIDGGKVPLFLSGRVTLYSGAAPGAFVVNLFNGNVFDITHRIAKLAVDLPASAAGYIFPFSLTVQAVYDVKTQVLYGLQWGVIDPANNQSYGWQPFILPAVVDQNSMNFAASYGFSVAPLSGTMVEIMSFGFGL